MAADGELTSCPLEAAFFEATIVSTPPEDVEQLGRSVIGRIDGDYPQLWVH